MKQQVIIEIRNYELRTMETKDYAALRSCVPGLAEWPEQVDIPRLIENSRFEVDLFDFIEKVPKAVEYTIIGKVFYSDANVASEVHKDIAMVKNQLTELGRAIDSFTIEKDLLNFNLGKNPVVINVQNDKLLAINDLIEIPEANYDDVQDKLDLGWMIITTYVDRTMGENGDALPTYVLGIHNENLAAKRLN